ncbi:hypothetical protein [Pseudomonas sp. NA-150]|uniref:hypothetical protein n=1 Tax=Pseudomonas sp. NA-150 TaxID=3367525 RepID=UPI0037CBD331
MSHSKGIIGALILSSLLLSPLAMAEESQSFAALNEARHAAFEQHETELAMQTKEHLNTQQASSAQPQSQSANHS